MAPTPKKKKNILFLNIAFVLSALLLLFFLWRAPEETTSFLPHDEYHEEMHAIKSKKEAEKLCAQCHDPGQMAPLPEDHPPKFRCLFCHKRD